MKIGCLMWLSLSGLLLNACAMQPKPEATLFQRIGGLPMLTTISSELIDVTANDERTKRSFEDVKLSVVKESLTNFLCVNAGGDCVYEGETMKKSHADANITTAEFELMVQKLRDILDAHQIGAREKNELLKLLAPTKRDIVTSNPSALNKPSIQVIKAN